MLILSSVFASVLKLRRVSDRALAAKIARYMFFISLVALIGGLATYTIIELVGGDVRVSGTIRDEDGEPIEYVTVSIDGARSTSSREDGTFEITIARSRTRAGIVVVASDPEYKVAREKRTTALEEPFNIVLQKLPINYHVVQSIDGLKIGHWLGQTWIRAGVVIENNNAASLNLSGLVADVVSLDGVAHQVPLFIVNAALPPITSNPPIKLRTKRIQRLDVEFYQPIARPDLIAAINNAVAARGTQIATSNGEQFFSVQLSSQLQEIARSTLLWKVGHWRVQICALLEGGKDCKAWAFDITDTHMKALTGIVARYPSGVGVLNAYRFSDNLDESGFVEVVATEIQ